MMTAKEHITCLVSHFPAIACPPSGQAAYYFDSAATACTLGPVIEAMSLFYQQAHGGVHRGIYREAERTTSQYELVRGQVAQFLNAASSSEIIFTSGATDSLNTVAYTWAMHNLVPGDGIIITQAEHHAHYVLWHQIAKKLGATVHVLPIDPHTWCVDLSGLDALLTTPIKVVAVTASSNVLGPIWGPGNVLLTALTQKARRVGATIVLDAAQMVAHAPVDVQKLDCDFLAFSVHKMGGANGLGVLYARAAMHRFMKPYRFGGGMVAAVSQDYVTWQKSPHCFEAGTPPVAQVIGLGALLAFYRTHVDFEALRQHEASLCALLINALKAIDGVHVLGNEALLVRQGHVVTWYVDDVHAHDLAARLSDYGCAVRAGDHCAQPLSAQWQGRATLRASFFMYNTYEQVMHLIDSIQKSVTEWRSRL